MHRSASFSQETLTDPVENLRHLIRCQSVTPEDDGAIRLVQEMLETLGFSCQQVSFGPQGQETPNLFATLTLGKGSHLCFASHTDVVPAGEGWQVDPFAGEIVGNEVIGRGAVDMKGGLACVLAAVARSLKEKDFTGTISFLITGDEEGPATFGTCKVLEWLEGQNYHPDFCLLAEPTSVEKIADVLKIGRRGSLNAQIKVQGKQGHVAYPHLAKNPVPILSRILEKFQKWVLDEGSRYFDPSSLQFTALNTSSGASNVIPAQASAHFNIRFNDLHSGASLSGQIQEMLSEFPEASVEISVSGDAFLTTPGEYVQRLEQASKAVTGYLPRRETGGGTSDARFISHYMPVAELGLLNKTAHAVDESVSVQDLEKLTEIFTLFLRETK